MRQRTDDAVQDAAAAAAAAAASTQSRSRAGHLPTAVSSMYKSAKQQERLSLIKAPDSWAEQERTHINGHKISSALEVAGDEVHFPATGATVRAVPAKMNTAISRPGDTFWRGASGLKPPRIGEDVGEAAVSGGGVSTAAPPDIVMHCRDDEETVTVRVRWDMSWSDVLDTLRVTFGRAVVFEYTNQKFVRTTCDDEEAFDVFCSDAEKFGCQASVDIINAAVPVSDFIADAPKKQPLWARDNMDDGTELQAIILSRKENQQDDQALLEDEDEVGGGQKRSVFDRLADAPYPIPHMLMLGGNGLLVSIASVIVGFFLGWSTLSAVSAALPCHLFGLSFFVSEVEDGASQLVRLGLGFCGFFVAILLVVCYSIAQEYIGLVAAFLILLGAYWYMELCAKARGWDSWFQGLINLWLWVRGGCPLVGIRKPEPQETIVILGPEPKATLFTMMLPVEERHPGAQWKEPKVGMKVKHIGQCLQVLSDTGNPMGPWEEGIIHKKTARQLRKWLVRLGKKTDDDFKKWKKLPYGEIVYIGFVSGAMHCQVEYQEEGISEGQKKPTDYHQFGENGYYELVEFEETDAGPGAGKYDDSSTMHTGGSKLLATITFLKYFARRFLAWLFYWIAFFSYFGMLYAFEYSIARYAVYQAVSSTVAAPGKFYNVQPGTSYKIHMHCKGGQKKNWDGRPPVIMEAMEGIGQGVYLRRIQDKISEYGVCCVYDRLGFGYSSDAEAGHAWDNRSPKNIARQLMYALTSGTDDTPLKMPVSFEKPFLGTKGENLTEHIRVAPPYVLLAHSAAALYARQFAHDYPKLVAGMVLIDPLPALKLGGNYVKSKQQQLLSPFNMQLCYRFLQPVGLIYNFFPQVVTGIFPSSIIQFTMNGGYKKTSTDYEQLLSRMFDRQWCPSVLKEYEGLYVDKDGIETVAAADSAGYDVPTIIWVRDTSLLDKTYSSDKIYKDSGRQTGARRGASWVDSGTALRDSATMLTDTVGRDGELGWGGNRDRLTELVTVRRSMGAIESTGQRRQNTTTTAKCTDCDTSWDDLMRRLNKNFRRSYIDPFTGKADIKKGDLQSCAASGCDEYTIVSNPTEIHETVIDIWNTLGYRTNFSSEKWHMELYGRALDFNASKFRRDLARLLRHVASSDILITQGPRQVQAPLELGAEEVESACDISKNCYIGYSGTSFGSPRYFPKSNKGYFTLSLNILGPSKRRVDLAQNNLRATENTKLDKTGMQRRTEFLRRWRILWVAEDKCLSDIKGSKTCNSTTVDVFASTYATPTYSCPQNTYRDTSGGRCRVCQPSRTSATGATGVSQCFTCQPFLQGGSWQYTYLKCDGKGCNQCPANTLSSPGALGLKACVKSPIITVTLKGPVDSGETSEAVTAHRHGRPAHKAYDASRFREIISLASGLSKDRVKLEPPKEVWNFTRTRCRELRGGCMFQVNIQLQAEGGNELAVALARLRGDECYTEDGIGTDQCPYPDVNKTAVLGRTSLFTEFEVLKLTETEIDGRDTGECPDRYEGGLTQNTQLINIFKEKGKFGVTQTTQSRLKAYECPSKFYKHSDGYCEPCPDMTTSDPGAKNLQDCAAFNTVIIAGKDASLTYEARTNSRVNGYMQAQPSALTLNDNAEAYLKLRGYALQPDERVDPSDISKGFQIDKCRDGLNCFNDSSFREALSTLLGTVTANEVRLVKPNTCHYVNAETEYDGKHRSLPKAMIEKRMCGPWPGLTPTAGKCVCSRRGDGSRRCFETFGPGIISPYIGTNSGLEAYNYAEWMPDVETVGVCAQLVPDVSNAFLYDPSRMVCSARSVDPKDLRLDLCSSHSLLCKDVARLRTEAKGFLTELPGMQMYFQVSEDQIQQKCPIVVEDSLSEGAQNTESEASFLCPAKLKSPLDTFYFLINLHAETKRDLDHAMHVLTGAGTCSPEQDCAQLSGMRRQFLEAYRITEIAIARDKELRPEAGVLRREISVTESGAFNSSLIYGTDGTSSLTTPDPELLEVTALCPTGSGGTASSYTPLLCMDGGKVDEQQPEALCKWVYSSAGGPETKPLCRSGFGTLTKECTSDEDCGPGGICGKFGMETKRFCQPKLTCPDGKMPECRGPRVFDKQLLSNMPMPCSDKQMDVNLKQPLCASLKISFKSTDAVSNPERCRDFRAKDCLKSSELLVTRVDVALGLMSEFFCGNFDGNVSHFLCRPGHDVPASTASPELVLSFSDGSDQLVNLTMGVSGMWSYYIRPVVTRYVTVRFKGPRPDGIALSLAEFDVFGQDFSAIFNGETGKSARPDYVKIFEPGYATSNDVSIDKFSCPATTYATKYTVHGTSQEFVGCVVCPYPTFSRAGSDRIGNCTCPQCGDGRVLWQAKEQCDDGNADENDGCSSACKIENLQLCHGSQNDKAVTPQFVGLPIRSYSVKDECFRLGRYWTSYGNAMWSARYGHGSVIHMDAIWVVGGIGTGMKELYNDVWFEDTNGAGCVASEFGKHCSENNGQNWVQARPSEVASHSDYKNESIDNYKAMRTFPPRGFHGLVNHKGFIWVLGGATRKDWHKEAPSNDPRFDTAFNDVWKTSFTTTSGPEFFVQWTYVEQTGSVLESPPTLWDERYQHAVVSFQGKIWVIGGQTIDQGSGGLRNDLWHTDSDDGSLWRFLGGDATSEDSECLPARRGHAATVDPSNTMIMLFGGLSNTGGDDVYLNDVWFYNYSVSSDGKPTQCGNSCWRRLTANAPWKGRYLHSSLVYQNSVWIVGGQYEAAPRQPTHLGDVWVSDGKEVNATAVGEKWNEALDGEGATARWNKRSGHAMVVHDTRGLDPPKPNPRANLWILGGMDGVSPAPGGTAHNLTAIVFQF